MNRFICIHGHFYQPPRENPWLEKVELQESAHPYHDWNSRITAECYGPNSCSRITDPQNRVIDVVNNYSRISFNFGPTLLAWLEKENPEVYAALLEADTLSRKRFSGHGSALAQPYNHMIMPLANPRDQWTQIRWGIQDFESRFQRLPEGMWLPETAMDLATLDCLARAGIRFTILSPRQAKRIRKSGDEPWQDVGGGRIDPRRPYLCRLPSGRSITIFFYDGLISQGIAFEGLLKDGTAFAKRLVSAFIDGDQPQLVHIANDGESYGHHHRFGDTALASALYTLEADLGVRTTIYGEFLDKFPPTFEVEIIENSSWSCVHGIERWRSNCGCRTRGNPDWNQEWRGPLRGALDWLRDNLASLFEQHLAPLLKDPWEARQEYLQVIRDRRPEVVDAFLAARAHRPPTQEERTKALRLLEMQRNAMLMYTSCGWFFEEISGLETVQVLRYAARAMQLARQVGGNDLEKTFLQLLEKAPSNLPRFTNGQRVYLEHVQPAVLDLLRVGVHFGVASLFKEFPQMTRLYSFDCQTIQIDRYSVGKQKAAIGKVIIRSSVTLEEDTISFAVFHLGDHTVVGGARRFMGKEAFATMHDDIRNVFQKSQIPDLLYLVDQHFEAHNFSLWNLFKDDQREIINSILDSVTTEVAASFQQIYNHHSPVMEYIRGLGMPLPPYFSSIVEFILSRQIQEILRKPEPDLPALEKICDETSRWPFELQETSLPLVAQEAINRLMSGWAQDPTNLLSLVHLGDFVKALRRLFGDLNLWREQNLFLTVARQHHEPMRKRASEKDELAGLWLAAFDSLGDHLKIRMK